MLNGLTIERFRTFQNMAIGPFGRVNLFIGMNNTGKTCLLEAIRIFAEKGNPRILTSIMRSRNEDYDEKMNSTDELDLGYEHTIFRHLFYGHVMPALNSEGISIRDSDDNMLSIRIEMYKYVESDEAMKRIIIEPEDLVSIEDVNIGLASVFNNARVSSIKINRNDKRRPYYPANVGETYLNNVYVPSSFITQADLSRLWDSINITDLEDEVLKGLQIIEPGIAKVALVGEDAPRPDRYRVPVVRFANQQVRIPLRSLGEGMAKLFHVILALVNAKNGILMVDEIENGLHWSVHNKLWEFIFELSERLNVQIFATTHSLDCLQSYQRVWMNEYNGDTDTASCFRLEKASEGIVYPFNLSCEALNDSFLSSEEIR